MNGDVRTLRGAKRRRLIDKQTVLDVGVDTGLMHDTYEGDFGSAGDAVPRLCRRRLNYKQTEPVDFVGFSVGVASPAGVSLDAPDDPELADGSRPKRRRLTFKQRQ